MSILIQRKKEIMMGLVAILIFVLLFSLVNGAYEKLKVAEIKRDSLKSNVSKIESGQTSEELLKKELNETENKYAEAMKTLPEELKRQDVNLMLSEISKDVKLRGFELKNCNLTVNTTNREKEYQSIRVDVKNVVGNYEEIKNFLSYVKEYDQKITISSLDISKEKDSRDFKATMTLLFYGCKTA